MRKFGYSRVSTKDQTNENQVIELERMGVDRLRISTDTVSGTVKANDRHGFKELLIKIERGDELYVVKLDRLGRDAIDIQQTIKHLDDIGVTVITGDIGIVTGTVGKLVMTVMAAMAEMERERIVERVNAGLLRAVKKGKKLGRKRKPDTFKNVQAHKANGTTQKRTAELLGIGIATVKRYWNEDYKGIKTSSITNQ